MRIDVTKQTFPTLFEAFRIIDGDNGIPRRRKYKLEGNKRLFSKVESQLKKMTEEDLVGYCIGEETEDQARLELEYKCPEAGEFLNAFFNGALEIQE
jgi:hypothetical protein